MEQEEVILSSFNDVNQLSFRELQKHCKHRGLEAIGNTKVLRLRLLEKLGLCDSEEECAVMVRLILSCLSNENCPPFISKSFYSTQFLISFADCDFLIPQHF